MKAAPEPLRFAKGQALGNDYIVIDAAEATTPVTPDVAVRLCDRHRGAGSDGVLLADLAARPVGLRIINPDGTEAEKSGNGLRIFAAFLHARGQARTGEWFDVRLATDTVSMRVEEELPEGAVQVRARMGTATFPRTLQQHELALADGAHAVIHAVSLGNPHCVVFVPELDRADFLRRAPQLCTHSAFAAGTNVQFARVTGQAMVDAWIWERGAGETLASGSSACAVAAAAVRRGLIPAGTVTVRMPGGFVEVDVDPDYAVELLGPAQMVYEGAVLPGRLTSAPAAEEAAQPPGR